MRINIHNLVEGQNYSNQDICEAFLCAPQGGMRRSKRSNTLVLVANHTKSIYSDEWKNGVLNYTGMGQLGDQTLEGNQNITLYESENNDISVHLFEVFKKRIYTYKGQVMLADRPFQETQDDLEGWDRTVWVFPLKEVNSVTSNTTTVNKGENSIDIKNKANEEAPSQSNDSILDTLVKDIGWSVRTTNSLAASGILKIRDLLTLSEYEILRIPNLGRLSLKEIKITLSELNDNSLTLSTENPLVSNPLIKIHKKAFSDIDFNPLNKMLDVPISSLLPLDVRTTNCFRAANIRTLGELINIPLDNLIRIPNLGRHSVNSISKHLLKLSKSPPILGSTSYLLDGSSLENYITSMESHLSDSEFGVLIARIGFKEKPKTLVETGNLRGVTRERIRQIQSKVYKKLIFDDLIKIIDRRLLDIRQNQHIPLYVNQISNYDIWFECLKTRPWILKVLLETFKSSKHNVEKIDGDYIVTYGVINQLTNFIEYLRRFIDEQTNTYTKKDLKDHIKLLFPLMANELTSYLFQKLDVNFTTNEDDSKSLLVNRGKGISRKILTIIESSEKPISSKDIYDGLRHSEASKRGTLNHLTKMNSKDFGVYLFGRGTYGVRKHLLLNDDEIDLIVEKINLHTLDDNKDKQFHCNEILDQVTFFPSHKRQLNSYTLSMCLRMTDKFNYLGNFMFVRTGSENTQIQKKDFSEMALGILEKSPTPLSSREIKKIISNDRSVPATAQLHKKGRLIPIKDHANPNNKKTSTWGLIDLHLKISKQQLIEIIIEMESLIIKYDYELTPDQAIEAIRGNSILEKFQDKILVLFVLVDKNINFIEKNNILYHVKGKIDDLSQEDCLKIIASKITEDGMRKQEIFKKTCLLYGGDVAYNILSKLSNYGFTFNRSSETWHKGELVVY